MGGKDKKGQRTKGNVRPSSSSRSAELLGNETGFIGFSGLPAGAFVPVLNPSAAVQSGGDGKDSEMATVDSEFRVVLRKMGKKDVTTKMKALQEFGELCEKSETEILKTVLQFWPRIYSRIATDSDRRVREAAQKGHQQLVTKLKRLIAPQLKTFMGVWYTSQCDTYAPAASVAQNSLQACFPGGKLVEAVAFCQQEILDYIEDCLLKQNISTMGDAQSTPIEDLEQRLDRVLCGALSGYNLLLHQCSKEQLEKCREKHSGLWSQPKLWKVVQHNSSSSTVKSAWFQLLSAMCRNYPEVVKEHGPAFCKSLLSFLEESDPGVVSHLWDAVLRVIQTVDDSWTHVNVSKAVVPRIMALLREGCYGNSGLLNSTLLELVSLLPAQVTQVEGGKFYTLLLSNLRQGLNTPRLWLSPSEAGSLATAFVKLFATAAESNKESLEFIQALYNEQIFPLLELAVKEKRANLISTPLIGQLALTLYKWTNQNCTDLISAYWSVLEKLCDALVQSEDEKEAFVLERLAAVLLMTANPSFRPQTQRRFAVRAARVRFTESDQSEPRAIKPEQPIEVPAAVQTKLEELVVKTCLKFLHNRAGGDMSFLALLLRNSSFSRALMERVGNPEEFMRAQIQPWLEEYRDENCASLLFAVLETVQPSRRSAILQNIVQKESVAVPLLSTALEKFSDTEAVRSWLESEQVQQLLERSARLVLPNEENVESSDREIHWHIIRAALCTKDPRKQHDSLLPKEKLEAIISQLTEGLSRTIGSAENFADFVSALVSTWTSCIEMIWHLPAAEKMTQAALHLFCDWKKTFSSEVVNDLLEIWRRGVERLLVPRGEAAIQIVQSSLIKAEINNYTYLERLLMLVRHLLEHEDSSEYFMDQILLKETQWNKLLDENTKIFILQRESLVGDTLLPQSSFRYADDSLRNCASFLRTAVFTAALLRSNEKFITSNVTCVAYLVYAAAAGDLVATLFKRRPSTIPGFTELLAKLKADIDGLVTLLNIKEINSLWAKLMEETRERKNVWPYALATLQRMLGLSVTTQEANYSIPLLKNLSEKDLMESVRTKAAQIATVSPWTESADLLLTLRHVLKVLGPSEDSEILEAIVMATDAVQHWQQQHGDEFLFAGDVSGRKDFGERFATVVEVVRFLAAVVEVYPTCLNTNAWDFVLCSLGSWCETLEESWNSTRKDRPRDFAVKNPALLPFTVAVCKLAEASGKLAGDLSSKKRDPAGLPLNLSSEWNDVFAEAVYGAVVPQFLFLMEKWKDFSGTAVDVVMESLSMCLLHVPTPILSQQLSQQGKDPLSVLCPGLIGHQSTGQLATYRLIQKMIPEIAAAEEKEFTNHEEDENREEITRPPPQPMKDVLEKCEKYVTELLQDTRIGDVYTVEPYSPECHMIIGYHLIWKLVFNLCSHSGSELRHQYASYLGDSGKLETLMSAIFRLIPHTSQSFSLNLDEDLLPTDIYSSAMVQSVAAGTYAAALQNLPAVVRRWFNSTDKRISSLVEKFTSRCVSPQLCASDLSHVTAASGRSFDSMTVKVRPSVREVVATYRLNEEASMDLIVKLPVNYPLGQITVEGGRKVGVSSSQWRNWILQLTTFLMHQNGSILDGLTLWKRNVDKRFEGVEECYICFYVLHGSNFQLPKLSCRTCKKKFHSACLYKWFSTSNNSTCPLCRNLF